MPATMRTPSPTPSDPMLLRQIRRKIVSDNGLMRVSNLRFSLRMLEQGALWGTGATLSLAFQNPASILAGAVLMGIVYARNLEFVHECIHGTAVTNRRLNVFLGTLLALPMLTSFQEWKHSHLRHHADVRNEGFQFHVDRINGWGSLLTHYVMLDHLREAFDKMIWSLHPKPAPRKEVPVAAIRDYRLMALLPVTGTGVTLILESWAFVYLWLLPLIPASIFNFHIQLPEHYECETDSKDALRNSRTVRARGFLAWLVNNNNYHTAHHWIPSVPIGNLAAVDRIISPHIAYKSSSYRQFFREFYRRLAT